MTMMRCSGNVDSTSKVFIYSYYDNKKILYFSQTSWLVVKIPMEDSFKNYEQIKKNSNVINKRNMKRLNMI